MAKTTVIRGGTVLVVTFRELADFWGCEPGEWGLIGPKHWSDDEELLCEEFEAGDGYWHVWRQDDYGVRRTCLEQTFRADELPFPQIAAAALDGGEI